MAARAGAARSSNTTTGRRVTSRRPKTETSFLRSQSSWMTSKTCGSACELLAPRAQGCCPICATDKTWGGQCQCEHAISHDHSSQQRRRPTRGRRTSRKHHAHSPHSLGSRRFQGSAASASAALCTFNSFASWAVNHRWAEPARRGGGRGRPQRRGGFRERYVMRYVSAPISLSRRESLDAHSRQPEKRWKWAIDPCQKMLHIIQSQRGHLQMQCRGLNVVQAVDARLCATRAAAGFM